MTPSSEIGRTFAGGPPIVCFANDYQGDPTSKHHIMRILAGYTDVLWVESAGMRRPRFSNPLDLRRILARLRRSTAGVRRDGAAHRRLHVVSPLSVPLPGRRAATRVNRWLYHRSVTRALARLRLDRPPLLWVYTPTVAPYLASLPQAGLVYHCVDRWWAFADYDAAVMRACHAQLCRQADLVFASSTELLADCEGHTSRAHLVRHGVDWEHFSKAALAPAPRPADIADIPGPIIGFFGLVHEWIDQDVLCRIAAACPDATLVLIGRVQIDASRLRALPNVRLLGQRPYEQLPAYAAAFDVALVPFVRSDLTVAVNPIKLREYLCAGVPVVATALPEIQLLRDRPQLRLAETPEQFVLAVRGVLANGWDRDARCAAARAELPESWQGRCAYMAELVRRQLGGRDSPRQC